MVTSVVIRDGDWFHAPRKLVASAPIAWSFSVEVLLSTVFPEVRVIRDLAKKIFFYSTDQGD